MSIFYDPIGRAESDKKINSTLKDFGFPTPIKSYRYPSDLAPKQREVDDETGWGVGLGIDDTGWGVGLGIDDTGSILRGNVGLDFVQVTERVEVTDTDPARIRREDVDVAVTESNRDRDGREMLFLLKFGEAQLMPAETVTEFEGGKRTEKEVAPFKAPSEQHVEKVLSWLEYLSQRPVATTDEEKSLLSKREKERDINRHPIISYRSLGKIMTEIAKKYY